MEGTDIGSANTRYEQQAVWTEALRSYLFKKLSGKDQLSILEVGCGTGAVIRNLEMNYSDRIRMMAGIDINRAVLKFAKKMNNSDYIQSDGSKLPFASHTFDLVYCHYLLLWVKEPETVIREMKRVSKVNGLCAVMAEPCYKELSAEPEELSELAEMQKSKLRGSGANINIGAELQSLFRNAGFTEFEFEKYQQLKSTDAFIENEIKQLTRDIGITDFKADPKVSYKYYVPTYFALAENKEDNL